LEFPNLTIASPWTAIFVIRIDSIPARVVRHLGTTAEFFTNNTGGINPDKIAMYSGAYQYSHTIPAALTTYRCVALVGDGTTSNSSVYLNFTKLTAGLANSNVSGNFITSGTVARVGAMSGASASLFSNESINEIIIYGDNKITSFAALQKYILKKYGI
jgi:hypothetical protein